MLILFSSPTITARSGSGEILVKGTGHYTFILGILDEGTIVKWHITTNDVSISLYIAERPQYLQYAAGMSWSPVYENESRTIHDHQYTIPNQANWTLVLENSNQADAQVTYDINIPVKIPSFTAIPALLGLLLAPIVRKRRRKK